MARKRYDAETKARAIALVQTGDTISSAAKKCGVPAPTLKSWMQRDPSLKRGRLVAVDASDASGKNARDGERLKCLVFDFVTATFEMMTAQARVASESSYVKSQPASELAVLTGVLADKCVRVVEAYLDAERIAGVA